MVGKAPSSLFVSVFVQGRVFEVHWRMVDQPEGLEAGIKWLTEIS